MEKNPRKKFLKSDSPKPFGKSASRGGKYGSKTFRPDDDRTGDFEYLLPKKKKRGVGGSDNQRGEVQKPLYSTGRKRPTRDEGPSIFREKKDFIERAPRRNEGDAQEGFSREKPSKGSDRQKPSWGSGKKGGFSRDEPRPFLRKKDFGSGDRPERKNQYRDDEPRPFRGKKDFNSRFENRDEGDGVRSSRGRSEGFGRGGDRDKPKPFLRSGRKEGFTRRDDDRPFHGKKDFNSRFENRDEGDGIRSNRGRGEGFSRGGHRDKPKPFLRSEKGKSFSYREEKPFREKREFKSKFPAKKSYDKKKPGGKKGKQEKGLDLTEPARLNKYLAHAGIASRRESDELIKSGFVTVNGQVVLEMGHKVQPGDEVRFKNQLLSPEKKVYILLNKPKDYITTASDERGRATVMELVDGATDMRIYPVGRLDRNTTGLLLLTNDGELAQKLTHPSFEAKKVYLASLDKPLKKEDMMQIADGVQLEEGTAMVDAVEYADPRDKRKIGIEIHIGWNKVVRRIFETLGYEVVQLDRVYYAGLTKDVPRGKWRNLTEKEVIMLKHFTK